jgi:hypothetical protein
MRSFEEQKIISNHWQIFAQKMQYGAKVGGFGKSQDSLHNHCKGSDARALYTDTK